jgi:uncharacterized protein (UPF0335 family)
MSNHLGDTNKMVRDTPRMKAAQMAAIEHGTGDVWRVGCDIERELNAANGRIELLMSANADVARIAGERDAAEKRIKRLEAELEQTKQDRNAIAKNTREPLLLQLDHANERIKRLEEENDAMRADLLLWREQEAK